MYAKVFTSIFDGSMRGHSDLLLVFVNILCHADKDGMVDRTCLAISDETGLSLRRVEAAIISLESPDAQSRSRNDDGRRLKRIDQERTWGWEVVNFKKYDVIRNSTERREYMRRLMAEKRKTPKNPNENDDVSTVLAPVSNVSPSSASASASTSTEDKNSSPRVMAFDVFWKQYPKKIGKGAARKAFEKGKCAGKIDAILKAIGQQGATFQWRKDGGQFIPHPATWLNQERWEDETTVKVQSRAPVRNKKQEYERAFQDIIRALRELKLTALTPSDWQDGVNALSDKYRDIPGALKEALEIVG